MQFNEGDVPQACEVMDASGNAQARHCFSEKMQAFFKAYLAGGYLKPIKDLASAHKIGTLELKNPYVQMAFRQMDQFISGRLNQELFGDIKPEEELKTISSMAYETLSKARLNGVLESDTKQEVAAMRLLLDLNRTRLQIDGKLAAEGGAPAAPTINITLPSGLIPDGLEDFVKDAKV